MAITIIAGSFGSGSAAAATTVTCHPGATIPVGSTVMVGIVWATTSRTISSVSDGSANAYTDQVSVANGTTVKTDMRTAVNIGTQLTTATTLTVTFSNSTNSLVCILGYTPSTVNASHNSNAPSVANPTITKALAQWEAMAVAIFGGSGANTFTGAAGKGTLEGSLVANSIGIGLVDLAGVGPTTPTLGCTNADTVWAIVAEELDCGGVNPYENTPLDLGIMTALRM